LPAGALAAYRQTVLLALQEVEDAMVAYVQERDRRAEQQDALARSEGLVSSFLVDVFRALGGGWQPQPAPLADEIEDAAQHGEPIF